MFLNCHVGGGVAGGEGVEVGEDHGFGAVVAEGGFVVAADDGEGVEDVGGQREFVLYAIFWAPSVWALFPATRQSFTIGMESGRYSLCNAKLRLTPNDRVTEANFTNPTYFTIFPSRPIFNVLVLEARLDSVRSS